MLIFMILMQSRHGRINNAKDRLIQVIFERADDKRNKFNIPIS
jgi:hypothetical protein